MARIIPTRHVPSDGVSAVPQCTEQRGGLYMVYIYITDYLYGPAVAIVDVTLIAGITNYQFGKRTFLIFLLVWVPRVVPRINSISLVRIVEAIF